MNTPLLALRYSHFSRHLRRFSMKVDALPPLNFDEYIAKVRMPAHFSKLTFVKAQYPHFKSVNTLQEILLLLNSTCVL